MNILRLREHNAAILMNNFSVKRMTGDLSKDMVWNSNRMRFMNLRTSCTNFESSRSNHPFRSYYEVFGSSHDEDDVSDDQTIDEEADERDERREDGEENGQSMSSSSSQSNHVDSSPRNFSESSSVDSVASSATDMFIQGNKKRRKVTTSISHDGCINTSCWLDSGWRFNTLFNLPSASANEPPFDGTNMSDIALSAPDSGTAAPDLHRRYFDSSEIPTQLLTSGDDCHVKVWDVSQAMHRGYATHEEGSYDLADVSLLATIATGHQANVFHVTTVPTSPGKILTSAADGYLKLLDAELQAISRPGEAPYSVPTTIISPEETNGETGRDIFRRRGMIFSHICIDENFGFACSETRGLLPFDLRLRPGQQPFRGEGLQVLRSKHMCKAVAIFQREGCGGNEFDVFVGGADFPVSHFRHDIRVGFRTNLFNSISPSNAVIYQPTVAGQGIHDDIVSVSGIDVSRDGSEILVSYEHDHCYLFNTIESNYSEEVGDIKPDWKAYGGHLNRHTFLKCAKFAGPSDQYICTGSDSGHAWVYDKGTGEVVSLLKADRTTCNGVVPHPSLPCLITYGIDSTAKLWCGSTPTDDKASLNLSNISHLDRQKIFTKVCQGRSSDSINIDLAGSVEYLPVLPDQIIATSHEEPGGGGAFEVGKNDFDKIVQVVSTNYMKCITAYPHSEEIPVASPANRFFSRVSIIRLRNQARSLGLRVNKKKPWELERSTSDSDGIDKYNHPSDLIPDFPSDWLNYDPEMTTRPLPFSINSNKWKRKHYKICGYTPVQKKSDEKDGLLLENDAKSASTKNIDAWNRIANVIEVLKDGGNQALKEGNVHLAARRYEKAIMYYSLVSVDISENDFSIYYVQKHLIQNPSLRYEWTPLLKAGISCHLNISMVFLDPNINDPLGALREAERAIAILEEVDESKYSCTDQLSSIVDLKAKAYYRAGCASSASEDYGKAVKLFDKSIQLTKKHNKQPENIVIRRYMEAKQGKERIKDSQRKKFRRMFQLQE